MAKMQHNRYSNFDFPEYVFREFPKAVTHNGKVHVVNDAEEEKAIKAKMRDYRKEALERAAELKLDIPDDWKIEKINAYIKKAESDLEFENLLKEESVTSSDQDVTQNRLMETRKPGRPPRAA